MRRAPPAQESPGAILGSDGACRFRVWAPARERVEVVLHGQERTVAMQRGHDGVFRATVPDVAVGCRYSFRLDGTLELPDPASRSQPDGVAAPSAVVRARRASSSFSVPALADLVLYELHVGTFTPEGTFAAAADRLDHLQQLGVNAVELMPLAQFPGGRNWGYDGVYAYAVQHSYGGPGGLAGFVERCHARGIAVLVDVVYNHLGPEGNRLADFGPYFTDQYATPWGAALNFDGAGCEGVRWHFIGAACYLLEELGVDGFRIDAVHAFLDRSARPFLQELTGTLHARAERAGRRALVIAESDLNDARVTLPPELGGFGMDAQWSDDFHHALHTMLTGEHQGYYADFGRLADLASAYRDGWVYRGGWSQFRTRRHGNSPRALAPERLVVYSQTHDQIGNRARGDRLAQSLTLAQQKLAAAAVLLSPYVPMLFMGQEWGTTVPFPYFTSHADADLQEAVRQGRMREFAAFGWAPEDLLDPQAEATFVAARLDWAALADEEARMLLELHRELIALRRGSPALQRPAKDRIDVQVHDGAGVLAIRRWCDGSEALLLLAFADVGARVVARLAPGSWRKVLDTEDAQWRGGGSEVPPTQTGGDVVFQLAPAHAVLLVHEEGA